MGGDEPRPADGDVFNVARIRRLVELMEQHGLTEVDLRHDDQRIKLRRGGEENLSVAPASYAPGPYVPPAYPPAAAPAAAGSAPPLPAASAPAAAAASGVEANVAFIRSPMVGTFYGRANPESEPFVKVGQLVSPDTTVCIIEAMKVFNEISAEVSGKILQVMVDNEEPVEFGKPLFKVELTK